VVKIGQRLRFENHVKGFSFVELHRDAANSYEVTFGALARQGSKKTLYFDTDAAADLAIKKHVTRLQQKGFLIGRQRPDLIKTIQSNIENSGAFEVYGDWLLEQGDARGELISAMRQNNSDAVNSLLETHAEQLFPKKWAAYGVRAKWRLGFIDEMTVQIRHNAQELIPILKHASCSMMRFITVSGLWGGNMPFVSVVNRYRPVTLKRIGLEDVNGTITAELRGIPGVEIVSSRFPLTSNPNTNTEYPTLSVLDRLKFWVKK
jgi:uncharacterized protein (TIGR02996 family)